MFSIFKKSLKDVKWRYCTSHTKYQLSIVLNVLMHGRNVKGWLQIKVWLVERFLSKVNSEVYYLNCEMYDLQ